MGDKTNRNFYIMGDIENDNIQLIIESIIDINNEDKDIKLGEHREPIKIYINSPGGLSYPALSLYEIIMTSITPVHTIALGQVMSAALIIFAAGKERYCTRSSEFMHHHSYTDWGGTKYDLANMSDSLKCMDSRVNEILAIRTGKFKKTWEQMTSNNLDYRFNHQEAIMLNLATGFLESII